MDQFQQNAFELPSATCREIRIPAATIRHCAETLSAANGFVGSAEAFELGGYEMDESVELVRAEYDAVPYESHAFAQSAPGHLAAVAYIFGLDAPAVSTARVLEIGSSAGGNLIPFAAFNPQAHVVGIDLSQVQVDQGRARVEALGLENLELLQGDIAAMDLSMLGKFDYVICHGVYSWVPDSVQDAILAAIQEILVPEGVAYLSYNTYPGWKAKEIVRDAMLMRGSGRGTPDERLNLARGMIDFLEKVAPADSVLSKAVAEYKTIAANSRDDYLTHEYLETFNSPCYFLELLDSAGEHGLAYLAEAQPPIMFPANYGDEVSAPLLQECGHSQVLLEQYLDFVVNRPFRQTLLVRADRASQISYRLDPSRFGRLHFAAWMPPIDGETRLDDSAQEYGEPGALTIVTQSADAKAALDALSARFPGTLSRPELLDAARARLAAAGLEPAANLEEVIDSMLEILILRGHTRYRLDPMMSENASAPLLVEESVRRNTELTRGDVQAATFNVWHEPVPMTLVESHLLPLLDGTRDRAALEDELLVLVRKDVIRFERDGRLLLGADELRGVISDQLDEFAQRLVGMKLLRLDEMSTAL